MTLTTTLYRFYDSSGQLLYVGIAGNPGRRFEQHAKEKAWWSDVARSTMEHHLTREAAAAAEVAAITTEYPLHNVIHNSQRRHPAPSATSEQEAPMDRLTDANDRPKSPSSLVGSYFHSGASPGWQGCVVAEPTPGVYLVELFSWLMGESINQTLVPLDRMITEAWQFYDDADWMKSTYDHGLGGRWEAERAMRADGCEPEDSTHDVWVQAEAPTRPSDIARAQLARRRAELGST